VAIDDYDVLEKIVSLIKSDESFEQKLLKFRLWAIDKYHSQLGFYSWDLSNNLRDHLRNVNEIKLRQIKFLFKEPPPIYNEIIEV